MTEQQLYSMTAFSRHHHESPAGKIVWEIRSVNHRYLEASFKLPEELRLLETDIRAALQQRLNRGKIECHLKIEQSFGESNTITINEAAVKHLGEAIAQLEKHLPITKVNPLELLQWPGITVTSEGENQSFHALCLKSFGEAADKLCSARAQEGSALKSFLEQRVASIPKITDSVKQHIPKVAARNKEKLLKRISETQADFDPLRLEQELVLFAQKIDISEEIDRIQAHCQELTHILSKGGTCGRRLDFLMQELNREANTLGSKSASQECSQASIDLKVIIEQMREQIQNIE